MLIDQIFPNFVNKWFVDPIFFSPSFPFWSRSGSFSWATWLVSPKKTDLLTSIRIRRHTNTVFSSQCNMVIARKKNDNKIYGTHKSNSSWCPVCQTLYYGGKNKGEREIKKMRANTKGDEHSSMALMALSIQLMIVAASKQALAWQIHIRSFSMFQHFLCFHCSFDPVVTDFAQRQISYLLSKSMCSQVFLYIYKS